MGVGICSRVTPVFQPQKFNVSTIGRFDTDVEYTSQISNTWSPKRVLERNEVNFYKTSSQDILKQQCDRRNYVPKRKMRKPSRKSSIKGPTFGRRFQGLLSNKQDMSVSSRNQEILDEIWTATQEAQRKARGNSGTMTSKISRPFNTDLCNGESTDESLKAFGGEDFDVERGKRSWGKSSFSSLFTPIERESYIQKNRDGRLPPLMLYESLSLDSFDII